MDSLIIQDFPKWMLIYVDKYLWLSQNIRNPHRYMTEILKLHELGMRLLLNPKKYGYWLLFVSTKPLKICMVGAFSACKICFAPTLPTLQRIFGFYCTFIRKICICLSINIRKRIKDTYKCSWTVMNQLTYPWISVPFGVISAWECSVLSLKCPSHDLD